MYIYIYIYIKWTKWAKNWPNLFLFRKLDSFEKIYSESVISLLAES